MNEVADQARIEAGLANADRTAAIAGLKKIGENEQEELSLIHISEPTRPY